MFPSFSDRDAFHALHVLDASGERSGGLDDG